MKRNVVPPRIVIQFIKDLDSALTSGLFHALKRANPKVSDQVLTDVVFHAWSYAKRKGLLTPLGKQGE
jgi:hypothetical protein